MVIMNIKTNHQYRDIICGYDLTEKERKEFDYYEMTIERTFRGSWIIATMRKGFRISRHYMGYTKREAIAEFKKYLKTI